MKKLLIFIYIACFCLTLCSCSLVGFSSLSFDDIASNIYIISENGNKTRPYVRVVGGHYKNGSGEWVTDDTLMFGTENIVKSVIENNESNLPEIYTDNKYRIVSNGKEFLSTMELFDAFGNYIDSCNIAEISEIPKGTYVGFILLSNIPGNFEDDMQEYYSIGLFFKISTR
jgi:hypothetical protein